MTQVIVHTNETGGVSVTYPTGELSIEEVLAKDCPEGSIIVNSSDLPQGEDEFFNAWELVNGQVIVNQTKKQAIINTKQATINANQALLTKLMALGLTEEEALALKGTV